MQHSRSRAPLGMVLTLVVAVGLRDKDLAAGLSAPEMDERLQALGRGLAPAAFVVLMIPGFWFSPVILRRWIPRRNAARAVYATSLLFAIIHSAVWPSPIPLFVLSLALRYIAYLTHSVIHSITLHSLFNL